MKAHIEGLWAYNDTYQPYDEHVRPEIWAVDEVGEHFRQQRVEYRPALHPVVRTHPDPDKRGLFVNESMTTFIKGIDRLESDGLLRFLFDHRLTPGSQYLHQWRLNDLAYRTNRTISSTAAI